MIFAGCDKDDDDNNDNDINNTDRNFTMMASMSTTAEIDAGTSASQKGESEGIRMYGNMMVSGHGPVQAQLVALASGLGLKAPDSLNAAHVALKAQLAALDGRAFDSVYIHAQVRDHQNTIALFEDQVSNGNNATLRNFATTTLPDLRHHLEVADSLAAGY